MSLTFKLTEDIPEPSTSVEELNNELTKMRKVVKIAKLFVRRDLGSYAKKLKAKSMKQPQNMKIQQKLEHRIEDIKLLEKLTVNRLCKRLLAAEGTEELAQLGHKLTPEDRLIARLGSTKPVTEFIATFREKHEDWRSLVHYLLYKNVSGKWKSRKQKRKGKNIRGSLPLPPGPSLDSVEDTNSQLNTDQYRIPKLSDDDESVNPPLPQLFDKPDDPDSDAASDIADAIVGRLIKNTQSESKHPAKEAKSLSKDRKKKKLKDKPKTKDPVITSSKSGNQIPESEIQHSVPEVAEDEDILGTDDVLMEKDTRKRFRTNLFVDDFHPKRRAESSYDKHSRAPHIPKRPRPQHIQSQSKRPSQNPKSSNSTPNLHPSWQAKREQQQKLLSFSKGPLPQTKHVVFDE